MNCPLRRGKVLILLVIALPALLGVVGLVLDGGLMTTDTRILQHATEAGATAGAMELYLGKSATQAAAMVREYVRDRNGLADANVTVHIPPVAGPYAGRNGYLEVVATRNYRTRLIHIVGAAHEQELLGRAVAGYDDATAGAAVVVLDPNPPPVGVTGIALAIPSYAPTLGGLEVLGGGTVQVDGAVLVNTTWGGVNEDGDPAGDGPGPPYGISCTPLLPLTRLEARDIRVAGGVDNQDNYGNFVSGEESPLRANRLPVPDPYDDLPVPSTASDPNNVNAQSRGSVNVISLPLLSPPTVLQPGVYDWIQVTAGAAVFQPGVYVIRSVNPATGIALNVLGGTVTANGVLFYITNSAGYDAVTGAPDDSDLGTPAAPMLGPASTPSVVLNVVLPGSSFSPLNSPGSPFHGLLVYQRRNDFRPIVVAHQGLVAGSTVAGTIYAKWGHVIFTGSGTYDLRIVAGSARLVGLLGMTLAPTTLLPPANDVFLVE